MQLDRSQPNGSPPVGIISVVFESFTLPYNGVTIIGFIVEDQNRNWHYRPAAERKRVPIPASEPDSITAYVLRQGVIPE